MFWSYWRLLKFREQGLYISCFKQFTVFDYVCPAFLHSPISWATIPRDQHPRPRLISWRRPVRPTWDVQLPWYDNKAKAITFTYKSYYFNDYSVLFTGVIHARYLPWAKLKISVSLFICSSLEADASFAGPFLHSRSDGTHGFGLSSWMENIKKQPWLIQLQ